MRNIRERADACNADGERQEGRTRWKFERAVGFYATGKLLNSDPPVASNGTITPWKDS